MSGGSLARQLLAASLAGVLALGLAGGATLSFAFRRSAETAFDAQLAALHDALVAALEVDASGRLGVERPLGDPRFERVFSGWYWQVRAPSGEVLASSRSLWDEVLDDASLRGAGSASLRLSGPREQRLRALGREITLPRSARTLRVVVAGDARALGAEIARFDQLLLVSLGTLGAGVLGLALLQLRVILRPLHTLRRELAEVRAGARDHVSRSAPRELAPLVSSLNDLLVHDAQVVAKARAQAADLAHALKTPLSLVLAEAEELADERGRRIARHADTMRRHVEFRLATATPLPAVAAGHTPVAPVVEALADTLARLHPALTIERRLDPALQFAGAREDLEEIVGNLLENACKWARAQVRIEARARPGGFTLCFEDDGPGLEASQFQAALARGVRLDEQAQGSGLGLAITADLVRLHRGRLESERSALGGLLVRVSFPEATRAEGTAHIDSSRPAAEAH